MTAGKPLDDAYKSENLDLLGKGMANLERHITNSAKFGVPVVVAVNAFATDSPAELDLVCSASKAAGGVKPASMPLHQSWSDVHVGCACMDIFLCAALHVPVCGESGQTNAAMCEQSCMLCSLYRAFEASICA